MKLVGLVYLSWAELTRAMTITNEIRADTRETDGFLIRKLAAAGVFMIKETFNFMEEMK